MSEKIEQFYRDATPDDVVRVMKGEAVEARFRDSGEYEWFLCGFGGYHNSEMWLDDDLNAWYQCQVYDPPAWFVNKPDPGEGFRLLEKFPPEDLQKGDEAFDNNRDGKWGESDYAEEGRKRQCKTLWYRRRIANNPEIPDSSNSSETPNSCRSRDTIPSGWRLLGKDEERLASDLYWSQGCKEWLLIGDDRVEYANEFESSRWYAIRRMEDFILVEGFTYTLPSGKVIRITAKGFEVL